MFLVRKFDAKTRATIGKVSKGTWHPLGTQ
jgi:hypothetical protein